MFQNRGKKNLKKLRAAVEVAVTARAPARIFNGPALCRQYVLGRFDQIASAPGVEKSCAEYGSDFDYERAAYNMIYNICESGLASGTLNIYRGVLSPLGEAIYALFENIVKHFEKCYDFSTEDCTRALENVRDAINELG